AVTTVPPLMTSDMAVLSLWLHEDGVSAPPKNCHDTISAFSNTACINTLAPAVDHSCLMSSVSLWLTPPTHGVKIIEVGATRAMWQASCPAPETMFRCE